MARPLPDQTDAQWLAIAAAAKPHEPSAQAREAVENCLRDHRGLQLVNPAKPKVRRAKWRLAAKWSGKLANVLPELVRTDHPYLRAALELKRWTATIAAAQDMPVRAREGRRDPAADWFYEKIFAIWINEFDGKLSVTTPVGAGAPTGPLIAFVLAVAKHAMEEPPSPHTIKDRVDRELERRKGVFKSKK